MFIGPTDGTAGPVLIAEAPVLWCEGRHTLNTELKDTGEDALNRKKRSRTRRKGLFFG